MKPRAEHGARSRPNRGRPGSGRGAARRRGPEPTRARLVALRVLERVQRAGAYADLLLHQSLGRSSLSGPDRAFATELVYGTLRWRGRIDHLLGHFLARELDKLEPLVATALRLGAYQILFADASAATAVDESVRCVRAAGVERAAGLVNAVLRRFAGEHAGVALPDLAGDPVGHLTHALSLPEWLARRWLESFGAEEAAALARACNEAPPLCVRTNLGRISRESLLDELRPRFPEAALCRLAPDGVVLGRRGNPAVDPAFLAGRFTVQDEGSQLVVALLDPRPGERVLDVCAAPGGKATAIAERVGPGGSVVAIDRHARRLDLVRRHARRLGLANLHCAQRDASLSLSDLADDTGGFDRVLVDAPCSGLGTLRRNPDARWRVREGDPARLAEIQRAILRRASAALRPRGVLVYSTCTLAEEENERIVEAFLDDSPDFALLGTAGAPQGLTPVLDARGALRCLPQRHDTDAFFAVRLERVA